MVFGEAARSAERSLLLLLRRALPRHHLHGPDTAKAALLRLQHDTSLFHHHARRTARVLHTERLGREGLDGHHDPALDDRLPDARRREHATDLGRTAARRSVQVFRCIL